MVSVPAHRMGAAMSARGWVWIGAAVVSVALWVGPWQALKMIVALLMPVLMWIDVVGR